MSHELLAVIIAAMLTSLGALTGIVYWDLRRSLRHIDARQKLVIAALLEHATEDDPVKAKRALLKAVEALVQNGKKK